MTAYFKSYEFFQDCVDEENLAKGKYQDFMYEYGDYAALRLGEYFKCVAWAYLEGCKYAKEVFEKKGLKIIHAYAIENALNDFIFEYDENERNEPDYDD